MQILTEFSLDCTVLCCILQIVVELSLGNTAASLLISQVPLFVTDEREDVQKKTFTKWVNAQLNKVCSLIQCVEIYDNAIRH